MFKTLPAIGVITAPITSNAANIHDESSYDIASSLIKSGIAGSTMVSADVAIIPRLLKIARVIHGEVVYFLTFCIVY
jgi:hypothetical protein